MMRQEVWQCEVREILTKTRMFDALPLKIVHLVKVDYIGINITMLVSGQFLVSPHVLYLHVKSSSIHHFCFHLLCISLYFNLLPMTFLNDVASSQTS